MFDYMQQERQFKRAWGRLMPWSYLLSAVTGSSKEQEPESQLGLQLDKVIARLELTAAWWEV